jgi:nicotinamidase-related amidase
VAKHALLVMDVQRVVVDRYPDPTYLPRLREAVGAARAGGLPVIYAVHADPQVHRVLTKRCFPTRRMSPPWPTG